MNSEFSQVGILNENDSRINPATEEKQDDVVAALQGGLAGAATNGQSVLASANTWVQVPGVVPTGDYLLTVTREVQTGVIRWSPENGGAPGVANGERLVGPISILLAGGEVIYFGSTVDTDAVNWSTKEVV